MVVKLMIVVVALKVLMGSREGHKNRAQFNNMNSKIEENNAMLNRIGETVGMINASVGGGKGTPVLKEEQ